MTCVSDTWVMLTQIHLQEMLDMAIFIRTNKQYGCELQPEIQWKKVQFFSHEKVWLKVGKKSTFS